LEKVTKTYTLIKAGKSYPPGNGGRMSHPDFHNVALPLSASAINDKAFTQKDFKVTVTPREMTG
jgi:hypothetical protein